MPKGIYRTIEHDPQEMTGMLVGSHSCFSERGGPGTCDGSTLPAQA